MSTMTFLGLCSVLVIAISFRAETWNISLFSVRVETLLFLRAKLFLIRFGKFYSMFFDETAMIP